MLASDEPELTEAFNYSAELHLEEAAFVGHFKDHADDLAVVDVYHVVWLEVSLDDVAVGVEGLVV